MHVSYNFNALDLETIDNELFLIGFVENGSYYYYEEKANFLAVLNRFFISCIKGNKDVVTWSKYDNTFIIKTLLKQFEDNERIKILNKIGKVTPIFEYQYGNFTIEITNIIGNSILFKITDAKGFYKKLTFYNIKNLFQDDLLTTAKDYGFDYYSKVSKDAHIIDKERFYNDDEYKKTVILSNRLDCEVVIDIAYKLLDNFFELTGSYPRTIFSAGSLARSYLMLNQNEKFNFRSIFRGKKHYHGLLDYAMRAYHGGKIESYVLGYLKTAKSVDITGAYLNNLTKLPKLTNKVFFGDDIKTLDNYFYAFINCKITIDDPDFIHPITIANGLNKTNFSPYGTFKTVITKLEYDFLIKHNKKVEVIDFYVIEHEEFYPYKEMMEKLFNNRMEYKGINESMAGLSKTLSNSIYGIKHELNDVYGSDDEKGDEIEFLGYRAGDFFNPVESSYITAMTRCDISEISINIMDNGGKVYQNMTDGIIYDGEITLDVFSDRKMMGKLEPPAEIKDVLILGAGRYEFYNEFKKAFIIKTRGFSVKARQNAYYKNYDLTTLLLIDNKVFVTYALATLEKYGFEKLGHIIEENYTINPFNLGGKRLVNNLNVNLNKEITTTRALKIDEFINFDI